MISETRDCLVLVISGYSFVIFFLKFGFVSDCVYTYYGSHQHFSDPGFSRFSSVIGKKADGWVYIKIMIPNESARYFFVCLLLGKFL